MLLNKRQRVLDRGLMGPFDLPPPQVQRSPTRWTPTSPGRTSGHTRRPSGFVAESAWRSAQPARASIGSRPCKARKNSRATAVRTRPIRGRQPRRRKAAAVLIATRRLATSSRNGLTSPSTILNGAPSWTPPGSRVGEVQVLPAAAVAARPLQTAAEQRSHLLRGHRVAGGQAIDPVQAGAVHSRASHPAV